MKFSTKNDLILYLDVFLCDVVEEQTGEVDSRAERCDEFLLVTRRHQLVCHCHDLEEND